MFEKDLQDLVKGIRGHKDDQTEYISKCLAEIKTELKSADMFIKAQALQKLIYLNMIGYDISWAAFHIVEVMSQPWFAHKRIGYLGASLCFTPSTDVVILTTHLFKKALAQGAGITSDGVQGMMYEMAAAINCLSNICTPDLAMDVLSDVYGIMNSSRPYIRKKAVLVLLPIFQQWPKALRLSFDRLKAKLTDDDPGVVSAAVYVVCELARKNPKNYLVLAPLFFKILTTSNNNWVLIKVVKLLGTLVPLEPRLAKKLSQPLADIIETTPAKSLLYECVNTLISGELQSKAIIKLCVNSLRTFIEDADQNLKYLGLLGLHKLMQQHPRAIAEHKDLILDCLVDDDVTIRMRALDLITAMVSVKNIKGVVRKLMDHLDQAEGLYREHMLERILFICSQKNYAYINDFEWYIATLVELAHIKGSTVVNATRIRDQLMDVLIRVEAVRPFGVRAMIHLLMDPRIFNDSNSMSEVLFAAGWLVGEYANLFDNHVEVLHAMLSPQVTSLSETVQDIFVQSVFKVLAAGLYRVCVLNLPVSSTASSWSALPPLVKDEEKDQEQEEDGDKSEEGSHRSRENSIAPAPRKDMRADVEDVEDDGAEYDILGGAGPKGPKKADTPVVDEKNTDWRKPAELLCEAVIAQLPLFAQSTFVEVQERAVAHLFFAKWLSAQVASASTEAMKTLVSALMGMLGEPMNPVSSKAQKKVAVPKGLDLDKWINEPQPDSDDEQPSADDTGYSLDVDDDRIFKHKELTEEEKVEAKKRRQRERERRANDPYYIQDTAKANRMDLAKDDVNDIPIKKADFDLPPLIVKGKDKDKKKGKRVSSDEEEDSDGQEKTKYKVNVAMDMPTGAKESDGEQDDDEENKLENIDLTKPLDETEVIPRVKTYEDINKDKKAQEKAARKAAKAGKTKGAKAGKGKKAAEAADDKKEKPAKGKKVAKSAEKAESSGKRKKGSAAEPKAEAAAAPSPAPAKTANILDMFDPLAPSPAAAAAPVGAPAAAAGSSSKASADKENGGGKKEKKAKSAKADKGAAEAKGKKKKSDAAVVAAAFGVDAARVRSLFKQDSLAVCYTSAVDQNQPSLVTVSFFAVKLLSKCGVKSLTLLPESSGLVRCQKLKSNKLDVAGLKKGGCGRLDQAVEVAKVTGPVTFQVTVKIASEEEEETTQTVVIPCSTFVIPTKISTLQLQQVLSQNEEKEGCKHLVSTSMELTRHTTTEALKLIGQLLNVKLIDAASFTATYYGLSVQGYHVAVLVKGNRDGLSQDQHHISVDIKSSRQFLSEALQDELTAVLAPSHSRSKSYFEL